MRTLWLFGFVLAACALLAWQTTEAGLVMDVNLARGGTASQSSTASGGAASRGNDGGLGPSYGTDKTTTHTNGNPFNKWELDLGSTFDLSQVDLYSRGDCCTPLRLGDFRLNVLDAPAGTVVHSQHFPGDVPQNSVESFSLPAGTSGRVVQVQIVGENGGANDGRNNAGNGILSLREVVVMGETEVPNSTNLARAYGGATQSSTRSGGGGNAAQFAIDGNTNGSFWGGSVTHTNTQTNPWWTVDLNSTFFVENIRLFNRTDCCGDRLNGANLSVLDESMNPVATINVGTANWSNKIFPMPYGTEGRYVRVEVPGGGKVLSLAEVQVFGGGLANVARNPNAVASQSSTGAGGTPDRAIDGNTNGQWSGGSVSHTNNLQNSWWEVDLGPLPSERYLIDEIILYNRADCCGDRLSNFRVSVFDDVVETFGMDYFATGNVPQGGSFRIALPAGTLGDRVRVQLNGWNNAGNGILSLAEVQVFASLVPEPSTLLVWSLLAGLWIGLGWWRRGRR